MLCLKKVYTDELLQLAILLSILRAEYHPDLIQIPAIGIGDGDTWDFGRSLIRRDTSLHPKNPDAMMLRDEQLLADIHNLGRYSRVGSLWQDVTAYMGLTNNDAVPSTSTTLQENLLPDVDRLWDTPVHLKNDSLSQEVRKHFLNWLANHHDMDLIEILWKQDVDMGFSIEGWDQTNQSQLAADLKDESDPIPVKEERIKNEDGGDNDKETNVEDQWAGKQYTIDLETGEYILKEELTSTSSVELDEDEPPSSLLPDPGFSLEEALELVGLNDGFEDLLERAEGGEDDGKDLDEAAVSDLEAAHLQEELDIFADMIQTPTYHPRHYQGRVGYSRAVSMEQRWQDLASLLSLPPEQQYGHHPLAHPASHHPSPLHLPGYHPPTASPLEHPAKAAPPTGATPETPQHYAATIAGANNVGSAVASSMNLMTNSSEPMGGEAPPTGFKMESSHDMMYYQQQQQQQQQQNSSGDISHNSTEGFLSSILNDEDLQLMDMAMNEGMYTMRMLEGASGGTANGGDSDSAVSSMGSERVPSLTSDTEWMETNSDSGHTTADHYSSDYSASAFSKYRWYDYGYGSRNLSGESNSRGGAPVAQKKHHMYGKRVFHDQSPGSVSNSSCGAAVPLKMEMGAAGPLTPHGSPYASPPLDIPRTPTQPELKYSCSVEFSRQNLAQHVDAFIGARSSPSQIASHNHTYHMLPENCGSHQRPLTRDKKGRRTEEETHLTRDERRARALNIPMPVDDIINLPMDEFNERLSKYDLSENQLSLIRDIRRRGKNKVAAQNCRKRKLDQILTLADEVRQMKERKARLIHERQVLLSERHRIKSKFAQLYRHIFQSLRDTDGNPYSPYEWSLQQTADGSVILVPRGNQTMLESDPLATTRKPDNRNP